MANNREHILLTTCDLLANWGFQSTGLNDIMRESGAPKGSIYYYFPEGKDEIVAETVRFDRQRTAERIRTHQATIDDLAEEIQSIFETIAYYMEVSGSRSGGPWNPWPGRSTLPSRAQQCSAVLFILETQCAKRVSNWLA